MCVCVSVSTVGPNYALPLAHLYVTVSQMLHGPPSLGLLRMQTSCWQESSQATLRPLICAMSDKPSVYKELPEQAGGEMIGGNNKVRGQESLLLAG